MGQIYSGLAGQFSVYHQVSSHTPLCLLHTYINLTRARRRGEMAEGAERREFALVSGCKKHTQYISLFVIFNHCADRLAHAIPNKYHLGRP
jgi:hypothetical protein